uniref:DUF4220 domain-containing protein n=1 Tax=Fagus sylvatica TaxID=28930 RepID=A0A2N9J6H7_FAGSY
MWNRLKSFQDRLQTILDGWEIPALVLTSLSLQSILIVLGYRRKFSTSEKLIFFPWITYLLASWVATVSLGIISNTIPNLDANDKVERAELDITAFWAPFFLLHLAGPDTITAYSLEDNSLWRRQALTLVSQVGVAVFIIIRAWENTLLNILTIVMFIPGLIKIGERIWVLRSGSSENFKATTRRRGDPGPNYARYMEEYHSKKVEGFEVTTETFETPVVSNISFPVPANVMIPDATSLQCAYKLFKTFKQLFSDLILSIQDIKNSQSYFQKVQFEEAFKVIEIELGFMYDLFYTKGLLCLFWKGWSSPFYKFLLYHDCTFGFHDQGRQRGPMEIQERKITYVLLSGAIILEIYSVLLLLKSDWSMLWLSNHKNGMANLLYKAISFIPLFNGNKRWSNTMGQYNLIRYCLKHKAARGDRVLRNAAKCPDCINKEKLAQQQHESVAAVEREFDHPVTENAKCIYEISEENRKMLQESVEVEFDQSILLWHIATDLCYYSDQQNSTVKGDRSKSVLFDGCKLAKSLKCLEPQKKWELLCHVWVEILCFAATKCRWNHHAQQLSRGGELFTHVWLLMAHLGITEQFQISKGHARAMLVVH